VESNKDVLNERLVAEGYERVKADLAALGEDDVLAVNLDVQMMVNALLGALPRIQKLRDRLAQALPELNLKQIDKLEDYVQALVFTNAKYQLATKGPDNVDELLEEATRVREKLLANAQALSHSDLFDENSLAGLKGANGLRNVSQDVQALSTALLDAWPRLVGKTTLTEEELKNASRIAFHLSRAAGIKEQSPEIVAAATDLRRRAFTLVFETYEEVRVAIAYVRRREGDANSIAPVLYQNKPKKKVDVDAPETTETKAPIETKPTEDAPRTNGNSSSPFDKSLIGPNGPFMK